MLPFLPKTAGRRRSALRLTEVSRSVQVYGGFLLPHVTPQSRVVDIGCGSGELSLGLARHVGRLVGVDSDAADIEAAAERAEGLGVDNATFHLGDAYALAFPADEADVVFAHSVLEALARPQDALLEAKRVLKPGGVMAAASVEYGGLILAGPDEELLWRFYEIRQQLWRTAGSDPCLGRHLRGLLIQAGFREVVCTTMCISYGSGDSVKEFGLGRAADCTDDWYVSSAKRLGLATQDELAAMQQAWLDWSQSPLSYAAFAWCQALGWKP